MGPKCPQEGLLVDLHPGQLQEQYFHASQSNPRLTSRNWYLKYAVRFARSIPPFPL